MKAAAKSWILGVASIVSFAGTVYFSCKATIRAKEILDAQESPPDTKEKIKLTYKEYIPAALCAVSSVACVGGLVAVGVNSVAAAASVYAMMKNSKNLLGKYRDKVEQLLGKEKEQDIYEESLTDTKEYAEHTVPSEDGFLEVCREDAGVLARPNDGECTFFDSHNCAFFTAKYEDVIQPVQTNKGEVYYVISTPFDDMTDYLGIME